MDISAVIHILVGSTFGLILRLFINYKFKTKIVLFLDKSLIVNVLSSLFLGVFVALSLTNQNLLLFFSVGFLGCFSTFSSFIYQLFNLIQKRKFFSSILYYIKVFVLSFVSFGLGYFITLIIKS